MKLPKGSKFSRRFGQKSGHKFMHDANKPVKTPFARKVGKIASVEEWAEKEAEEESKAKPKEGPDYHEIIKMVAEAYGIDLTTPEGLDNLHIILREADRILEKRDRLEDCESEVGDEPTSAGIE